MKQKFKVFTRTWWKVNKEWPNGLEPHMGRKKVIGYASSFEQAKQMCDEFNNNNNPGKLSRKAEFEAG